MSFDKQTHRAFYSANATLVCKTQISGEYNMRQSRRAVLLVSNRASFRTTPTKAREGWDTDCHGQTFADGKFWINNSEVKSLLKGDKYQSVKEGQEQVGDVVVYTDEKGNPEDSRTVTKTGTDEGTCVSGQGGLEDRNYETQIDQTWCNESGTTQKQIYRKTQADTQVSCEQAQNLINKTREDEK